MAGAGGKRTSGVPNHVMVLIKLETMIRAAIVLYPVVSGGAATLPVTPATSEADQSLIRPLPLISHL